MMAPQLVFYNGAKLLEAPYYDAQSATLYFVAVRYNAVYAFHPKTLEVQTIRTDGPVGGAVLNARRNLITAEKHGIFETDLTTGQKTLLRHILPKATMRYNHCMFDPRGRLLVDVMGDEERCAGEGGLYSVSDAGVACLVSGTTVANGIAFSPDGTRLYFADTVHKEVMMYDYDIERGTVRSGRTLFTLSESDGKPDGVYLDTENTLWISEWGGGKLSRWDSTSGEKLAEVPMPCQNITACCQGGDTLEYLYITTAKASENDNAGGGLYQIRLK